MSNTKNWTAQNIREAFLSFFEQKNHKRVSSAPIVIKDDPTLMFTNAGMNQFKDAFLGNAEPEASRVTDTQKCLRVSGKHNDLEEVGHDTYHHTMFEMLGNWSFGDYFKTEAIEWAWELLTKVYGLPENRLYVTVFEGDKDDDLPRDEDAAQVWKKLVEEERILNGNKKDNFWEMGATGPCGPCSEIHIDLRSEEERKQTPGSDLVNQDHPQVVEIWNLVFMEFNRLANGSLKRLPAQHVDTGMGFERLCMALQNKRSNYDTDVFTPLLDLISQKAKIKYGKNEKTDIAMRVIADHVRAVAFAIADGQLPSNNGAGYVIRRILRRAIRYGFSYLNLQQPFIFELVAVLARQMGAYFPEIVKQQNLVEKVIKEEEQSFLRTLEQGLNRLEQITASAEGSTVEGAKVFELYDTFGFPPDLTGLILKEKGFTYDASEYQKEMQLQKDRARAATKLDTGDWTVLSDEEGEGFIGYDHTEAAVKILRYREISSKKKKQFQLVFDQTPFYPEGGGQVGDTGCIKNEEDRVVITDTKKEHGLIVHLSDKLPANPQAVFHAEVDESRRKVTSLNHSATHLLHQALREVLGEHVEQKGSLVHPEYLRFDFSHFSKVSAEEIETIERIVNERVRQNFSLEEYRDIPIAEAQAMGAMALFGEKYGDTVRAIKFGDSIELCGGIHVPATGQIGLFTIVSEGAVAAGIRRIEAYTGEKARGYLKDKHAKLQAISEELKNPKDLLSGIHSLKKENAELKKEIESFKAAQVSLEKKAWQNSIKEEAGLSYLFRISELDGASIKNALFQLKSEVPNLVAVIGSRKDNKPQIAVAFSDAIVKDKGWQAGKVVKELAREINGGGGGQPAFAMAGGSKPEGLEKAIEKAKELLK